MSCSRPAMSTTYKTGLPARRTMNVMTEPIRFDTKIAILLRDDLAAWQRLNVAAFVASGIAAACPETIGEPYLDASGTSYLPMLGQPVLIFAGDRDLLASAHRRSLQRGLAMAIFTAELFGTGNDRDNRAAVAAVERDKLDLVGIAVHGPKNAVDKAFKGAEMHR